MSPSPWIVVWDLDHTLGTFESLTTMRPGEPVRIRLRPGIGPTIARLREHGFEHTVLTVATPDYARVALRGAGLWDQFTEVAARGQRVKGDAEGIAQRFGIELERRPDKMIFVGDHPLMDPPGDPRVVFHLELRALERPASHFEQLVLHLRERGEGSLRAGFDRLIGERRASEERPDRGTHAVRRRVAGVGRLLLLPDPDDAPKIAFDDPIDDPAEATELEFLPDDVA